MKHLLSVAAIGALSVSAASAQVDPNADINPWQDCGLGAMVFPENGTAAAISNIIWDLGTTAVSSNVSSKDSCKGARVQLAMYIQGTYAQLETEAVRGSGEYLDGMGAMARCDVADRPALNAAVREGLGEALAAEGYAAQSRAQKAEALFGVVEGAQAVCQG